MGPYMRPIPIGASAAMIFSLLVAFMVTPWAAVRILKSGGAHHAGEREDCVTRLYRRVMGTLLHTPLCRWSFLGSVVILLLGSCALFYTGFVKVKMLPFDNKSEFQVIIDMPKGPRSRKPRGSPQLLAAAAQKQPEVVNLQTYAGTASPYNFNGLVRHYFLRRGSNVADIQVNLLSERRPQAAEPRHRQARAPAVAACRRALRRAHQGRRSAARTAGAPNPGRRSLRPRRCKAVSTSRAQDARSFRRGPTASSMSIGTWKTINRSTACSWTRKRPRSTASPRTTSLAAMR